jgi:hypothetical protein
MNVFLKSNCLIYLPTVMYSSSTNDAMKATSTSNRGLKADTYKGPFMRTHQANRTKHTPDANIPYKTRLGEKINRIPHNLVYFVVVIVNGKKLQGHSISTEIKNVPQKLLLKASNSNRPSIVSDLSPYKERIQRIELHPLKRLMPQLNSAKENLQPSLTVLNHIHNVINCKFLTLIMKW